MVFKKSHLWARELNMLSIWSLPLGKKGNNSRYRVCMYTRLEDQTSFHPEQCHRHLQLAMPRNSSSYASQSKSPAALYIRSSHPSVH
jgi:hypothetical protein